MPSSSLTEIPARKASQCQYQSQVRREKQTSAPFTTILHEDKGEDAIRMASDERRGSARSNSSQSTEKPRKKKKSIWCVCNSEINTSLFPVSIAPSSRELSAAECADRNI
ncbi:hypothetical protein Dda_2830 [Drechslerella dactyloides]|uniref:Uncharacterized protein n=1 Tax=Drechslerella dactyloides TaxID=74499 RepID=A0AAD6NM94_DREDA|nr:hypothetical protein Dda_2830 [Drechslerella dactyloides]